MKSMSRDNMRALAKAVLRAGGRMDPNTEDLEGCLGNICDLVRWVVGDCRVSTAVVERLTAVLAARAAENNAVPDSILVEVPAVQRARAHAIRMGAPGMTTGGQS